MIVDDISASFDLRFRSQSIRGNSPRFNLGNLRSNNMKFKRIFGGLAVLVIGLAIASTAVAQKSDYRVSTPYTYKNLTIFLIHGRDESSKGNIITLQEAMERKLFAVYETGEVNELEVENLSKELDVFIQSGISSRVANRTAFGREYYHSGAFGSGED